MPELAIKGIEGSYHWEAARLMHGEDVPLKYMGDFPETFDALRNREVDQALLAISNTKVGDISTLEAVRSGDFYIAGEYYLRVRHQLLVPRGVPLEQIREVHSAVPALGQCTLKLSHLFPQYGKRGGVKRVEQEDTAFSARLVSRQRSKRPTKAAIASSKAAEIYGLDIRVPDIQDETYNVTRFVLLERNEGQEPQFGDDKMSMVVTTKNVPKAYSNILDIITRDGVDLSAALPNSMPNHRRRVNFFIEVDAAQTDLRIAKALGVLAELDCEVTPIGSYKRAEWPEDETQEQEEADNIEKVA